MRRRSLVAPIIKSVAFVVVTVLATAVLGVSIANTGVGAATAYLARFSDASGLDPGDQVRIAGVRVGEVEDVSVVDRRIAQVRFTVEAGRELPSSVIAKIKFLNLVGERYIDLERGIGPPGETLAPGGTIPLEQTEPALDLTALFNGFKPLFRALSPKDVNQLAGQIIQVFQGESVTVDSLVEHTASLTSTLAAKDKIIGQLIDNLNHVLKTVNARGDALADMVTTLQRLVSGLAEDREAIGDAVEAMSGLATSTADLLRETRPSLEDDIELLGQLSTTLVEESPTVERFFHTLPIKLEQIGTLNSYGSWLNLYLCEATLSGIEYQKVTPPPSPPPPPLNGIPLTAARCSR